MDAETVAEELIETATVEAAEQAQVTADQALTVAVENVSEAIENRQAVEEVAEATQETAANLEQVAALCRTNTQAIAELTLLLQTSLAQTREEISSSILTACREIRAEHEQTREMVARMQEEHSRTDLVQQENSDADASRTVEAENAPHTEAEPSPAQEAERKTFLKTYGPARRRVL